MKNIIYSVFLLLTIFVSCEKTEIISFKNQNVYLIVDAMITNTSDDNYVRLTLSDKDHIDTLQTQVIISDDKGNTDTLRSTNKRINISDTVSLLMDITKIKGVVGHTYFLNIKYKDQVYTASSYMQAVSKIDTLFFSKVYDPIKIQYYYPPLISFAEPKDENNYYLFCFYSSYKDVWGTYPLTLTIVNDDLLPSYVNGFDVYKGYAPEYWINGYTWLLPGDAISIKMFSISKEGYEFWKAATDQIESDGGIFNPAPATPIGNIKGGAYGLFQASAVSSVEGQVPLDI